MRGVVYEASDSTTPISEADVRFFSSYNITGADGEYEVAAWLDNGPHDNCLIVTKAGYHQYTGSVYVPEWLDPWYAETYDRDIFLSRITLASGAGSDLDLTIR
jgi:hypothetical protein